MSFALLPLNTGDGSGGELIGDQFAQGGSTATVVFSGIVFGPTGGPYTSVSTANPLPVAIESALPAGTNVIGHVIVDSIAALPALPPHQSTNVDQIGGAAIALGQAASAASVPVVIASNQSAVPVSGTLTADQGGVWTVGLSAGTQVEITDGTNTLGTPTHPVRVDPVGTTTQPVSGTVTANAGTNLDTSALALESGGNLAILAGAVSAGKVSVEVANSTLTIAGTVTADQGGSWQVEISDGEGHTMPAGDSSARSIHTTIDNASLAVTGTFWQATQPVSGTVAATQSGTWNVGTVGTVTTVSAVTAITDALPAGTNNLGFVTPAPAGQAGGATPFKLTACAATTNATSVKNAATTLWEIIALNVGAAPTYLKFYDKASAPTVGTDTPVYVLPLPSQGTNGANGAGAARSWPTGLKFSLGLAYAITAGMADTDTTAVAANQVLLSGSYG